MRFLFSMSLLLLPYVASYVQPEVDGRSYFAVAMGDMLKEHLKSHGKESEGFMISPAAAQKTLAILYNTAADDAELLDFMLLEMGLKYYDAMRLMEIAMREMTSFDVLKEERFDKLDKPIRRADVLDYFKIDFEELENAINYECYITTPTNLRYSSDFTKFAKSFFNATLLLENDAQAVDILSNFNLDKTKMQTGNLNIFNVLTFETSWQSVFTESQDHLRTHGRFRYGEITSEEEHHLNAHVLELPLDGPVAIAMLLVMPKHDVDLDWTTNYEVTRALTDPSSISYVLKEHLVELKLPKEFVLSTKTDLNAHFVKNAMTRAKIFEAAQPFERMFENLPKTGIKLDHFWQKVSLKINAKIVDKLPTQHGGILHTLKEKFVDFTQSVTFDITEKPFLFMLKSENVIYFMGYHYGKK